MIVFEPLQPATRLPVGSGHALQPGAMLEDFEITQVLGLTSFGVIYLATNVVEQTTVALKEYLPVAIAVRNAEGHIELRDPSHEEAFQRGLQSFIGEALTLSQFNHPNLLHVTCVWEGNCTAYRAMPHYPGTSLLAKRFGMKAPPNQAALQTLLDGLLGALQTLNSAGLAHGQVEPINIVIGDDWRPVLLDFDAARHAILSDMHAAHVDAYADTSKTRQHIQADLHAVAAVLHFALSGQWTPSTPGVAQRHEPLAVAISRVVGDGSGQDYRPDFLSAIDTALALPPAERPASVVEFRALFNPRVEPVRAEPVTAAAERPAASPAAVPPPVTIAPPAVEPVATVASLQPKAPVSVPAMAPARPPRREVPDRPQSDYPLNSSESVLALLAGFDRRPKDVVDDIEPFESPTVPTLTEEAEPTLPPMRTSLFDAMDAGDSLPRDGVGYLRPIPMPPVPRYRWGRVVLLLGVAALAIVGLVMLASHLFR